MDFNQKVVFVTGANSGIGAAQVALFLEKDAYVYGFDLEDTQMKQMKSLFPKQFAYSVGDVSNKFHVKQSVKHALETFHTIHILLNTAGVLDGYAKTLDTDEELWDRIMNTNVKGTYFVTNEVLPIMLEQKKGAIINMASIAGLVAGGGGAAYTASKHAIVGYTKQVDQDYCREGIRVNAIAPGAIHTPMNAADFEGDGEMAKWVAEQTPAGRWAKPEEVASLTSYLASDDADYIHGTVIPIDGGWIAK